MGGDGKTQADEDEYRRYDYKYPVIQLLLRSYMHIWGTKGEHIGWRNYKECHVKRPKIHQSLFPFDTATKFLSYLNR